MLFGVSGVLFRVLELSRRCTLAHSRIPCIAFASSPLSGLEAVAHRSGLLLPCLVAVAHRSGQPAIIDLLHNTGKILALAPSSFVLEFICLPWSEVCSARVTSLILLLLLLPVRRVFDRDARAPLSRFYLHGRYLSRVSESDCIVEMK